MIIDDTKTSCMTRISPHGAYIDSCRWITIYPCQGHPHKHYVEIRVYRSIKGYAASTSAVMPIDLMHGSPAKANGPHYETEMLAITAACAALQDRYRNPAYAKVLARYLTALHNHLAAERQMELF